MENISEVLKERLEKIRLLQEKKIQLYPNDFLCETRISKILDEFEDHKSVRVAARLMSKRLHGKGAFAYLKDETGRIQIYVRLDMVGPEAFELFSLLDIGDLIGVEGKLFLTKTQERSIKIEKFQLLSKI